MILQFRSLVYAILGMIFSAAISYYVGKALDRFHKRKSGMEGNATEANASEGLKPIRKTEETIPTEEVPKEPIEKRTAKKPRQTHKSKKGKRWKR